MKKVIVVFLVVVVVIGGYFLMTTTGILRQQKPVETSRIIPVQEKEKSAMPSPIKPAPVKPEPEEPSNRYEQSKALKLKKEREWVDFVKKISERILSVEQTRILSVEQSNKWVKENGVDLGNITIPSEDATVVIQVGRNATVARDRNGNYRVILPAD